MKSTLIHERIFFTGYDKLVPMAYNKEVGAGCYAHMNVTATSENLILSASLKTPFGEVSRSFAFSQDVCFRWEPIPGFKLVFILTKVNRFGQFFKLQSWMQARFDSPAWSPVWASYNHSVSHECPDFFTEPETRPYPALNIQEGVAGQTARRVVFTAKRDKVPGNLYALPVN